MSFFRNIFTFLFVFIITLVILEIYVKFSFIETQSSTDFTEEYGRCRRKNMDYVYFNEGFSMGYFNEGRYQNSYYPIRKTKKIIRIAALGDSYVEGHQVFERNHFLKIAEMELNKRYTDSVQILNFGRSGFDFGDMYAIYERMVKQYNCDYVLFFLCNDDLNIIQSDPLIPKVEEINGELVVTNKEMPFDYKRVFKRQLLFSHYSTLYNMLNDSRKLIKAKKLFPKLFDKFYKEKTIGKQKVDTVNNLQISNLSFLILDKLASEHSNIIIINRDKNTLNRNFTNEIKPPLSYIDMTTNSGLYHKGFNPHKWTETGKIGHWNLRANRILGEYLGNNILSK